jgi:glycosyltransferase involved in cell wall biosynthesis
MILKNYKEGFITVYTPTYNRAYCLGRLYESLLNQNTKCFEWLVIDDGSTDNTKQLIEKWLNENKINIKYHYQPNKGKQEAVNFAHSLIENEINLCLDSDDFLTDDALIIILEKWKIIRKMDNISGLVGLDVFKDGSIVGTKFPEKVSFAKFSNFQKLKIKGDKKFVFKTSVINSYPNYPCISNEKFPAPGYLYRLIDKDYDLFLINEILCVVEYLNDGISKNKFKQYAQSPNSFAFYRLERMRLTDNFLERFVNAAHFVNSCIHAKKKIFSSNPYFFTTLLSLPLGIFLYIYFNKTNKKGKV